MKEHISALNTETTAMRSFIFEQMFILKKSAPPISDTYPEQISQYINVLLEQIHHLRQENKNKTCIIQALIENQNDFQNITKGTQNSWNNDFKKNNITDKHAGNQVINISGRYIISSNRFSALPDIKGDMTNKHAEDHVITIPDQDTASSNKFSAFTNNNDDISVTKIRENSEKLGLRQNNDNLPKQLTTTLNVHSKKTMVTDSKRKNNISSTSKNSKSKNLSVIIGDSIAKGNKC